MINNLKDLQQLIKLCQKSGLESIKLGDVELKFSLEAVKPKEVMRKTSKRYQVPGLLTEETKIVTTETWEDLTPEQQLFYSSVPEASEQHS